MKKSINRDTSLDQPWREQGWQNRSNKWNKTNKAWCYIIGAILVFAGIVIIVLKAILE